MVAGLEEITEGVVRIDDTVVNYLPARERDVAMVFQNYALYPQMNVFDNIGFGLKMRKMPKPELRGASSEIARMLGLEELLDRKPANLSGGQRQRVAMGRAIARQPQLFLMDEPLSNLDAKLRVHMRAEIARLQRELGVTTLYVTHDQVEAMTMGGRIAVMRRGELQQFGDAAGALRPSRQPVRRELPRQPVDEPAQGRVVRRDGGLAARLGDGELDLPETLVSRRPAASRLRGPGGRARFPPRARPPGRTAPPAQLRGSVLVVESLGSELLAHVEVPAEQVVSEAVLEGARVEQDEDRDAAARRRAGADDDRDRALRPRDARRRPATAIELAVNPAKLHLFDLESGLAIVG